MRLLLLALAVALLPSPALAQSSPESRLAAYRERVERLEDQDAIENLQAYYGYYFDKGLWGEVASLFTADGSFEYGTGEFPEGWPADLTLIPGFTLLAGAATPDGLTAQMSASGDQTTAVSDYVKDLQANQGWAVDPSIPPGTPNMWALTKEGKVATIFSAPTGNDTVVVFNVTDR